MTSQKFIPKFVVLVILDGWGIAVESPGNAITLANTINMDKFWSSYPHTQLEASGQSVGLPSKEDGNTETGHLNLGAGRIVYQDLQRINMAVADGSFLKNDVLNSAVIHAKKNNSSLHLMGLVGAGGVHSNIEHLFSLIKLASLNGLKKVYIHVFTDGRDSPPQAAKIYIGRIKEVLKKENVGEIASVIGRYWSMDRDERWDRTEKAYLALTEGKGRLVKSPEEAIEKSYDLGRTDEFIDPSLIVDDNGKPRGLIKSDDAVIFFNFRIDRPRQLSYAFVVNDLAKIYSAKEPTNLGASTPFRRVVKLNNLIFVTLTEYSKILTDEGSKVAFPPEVIDVPLSSAIASAGFKQLKVTESEKERFVTFYFNGLRDKPFSLEDREIVPSPKVPTYDQKPEMAAREVTEILLKRMANTEYKLITINYPNADMVGHTGNIGATVKAVETIDGYLDKIANFVLAYEGAMIITSDHGNAEEMINQETGEIDTEHSTNKVPFIAVAKNFLGKPTTLRSGILGDVAPTILSLLGIKAPSQMTGRNLLDDFMREFRQNY